MIFSRIEKVSFIGKISKMSKIALCNLLLTQINSEEDKTGMMWGDAGRLYFWMKKQDLKYLDFDKYWLILQCY